MLVVAAVARVDSSGFPFPSRLGGLHRLHALEPGPDLLPARHRREPDGARHDGAVPVRGERNARPRVAAVRFAREGQQFPQELIARPLEPHRASVDQLRELRQPVHPVGPEHALVLRRPIGHAQTPLA